MKYVDWFGIILLIVIIFPFEGFGVVRRETYFCFKGILVTVVKEFVFLWFV